MDATPTPRSLSPKTEATYAVDRAIEVIQPSAQRLALVLASPHSGTDYPAEFVASSRLDPITLRRSEDSFVDELFGAGPHLGAPLLKALFPRAYLDPNREPYELDPTMFEDPLPDFANTRSPRVSAGLGTVARLVASGAEIYGRKLRFAEVQERVDRLYRPYHRTLQGLIGQTVDRFGCCLLVDCHSMPSVGGPMDTDTGTNRVDFVLGDCYGTSCAGKISRLAEDVLTNQGYRVVRNQPYAGGFTTRHYGQPKAGVHALQIEINRRLYMNEATHERLPRFSTLAQHLSELIAALGALPLTELKA